MKKIAYENKDKYEKLYEKYNNDVNELYKYIDNLKKEYYNLENKINENKDNNDLIEKNKINEEKIKNLYKIIDELENKNKILNNELYNINNDNNINKNYNNRNCNNLKNRLFYLLLRKYIDKNTIFDKREFLNLLMERKHKQRLRNVRVFNEENDRKYRTADDSMRNVFKSKSRDKKIELLRSSFKKDYPY